MNFFCKRYLFFPFLFLVTLLSGGIVVFGALLEEEPEEGTLERYEKKIMEDLELDQVEREVDRLLEQDLSFQKLVEDLLHGKNPLLEQNGEQGIRKILVETLENSRVMCAQILLLVIFSSLFSNLSVVFQNRQIGEISFYIVYLLVFAILLKSFDEFSGQIHQGIQGVLAFMRVLLPSYHLAVTVSTGAMAGAAFYQMVIFLIFVAESLILHVLFPAVRFYLLLNLVNELTGEEFLSRLTELLESGMQWALKFMVGAVFGLQMLQRLIAPAVDSLKRTMLGKTVEAIPGIGGIFGSAASMLLGSAVLIKNCLGVAAVLILAAVALPPLVRAAVLMVYYRLLAALVQPVTDKRMTGCLHTMGSAIGMLLRLLVTVEVLFFITIAVLAGSLG